MQKRILIVTPRSPFSGFGACEEDRLEGIRWFIRHGYETTVVVKVLPSDISSIDTARNELGIRIIPVLYKFNAPMNKVKSIRRLALRLIWPPYWDGAAYEYFDPEIQKIVADEIHDNRPDIAYFDYSYLWPLYKKAREAGIPIVTRSINMEPIHFLDENGRSLFHYLRALPKWISEFITARKSSVVFAITPKEEHIYALMGANSATLPLRGLPRKIEQKVVRRTELRAPIRLGYTAGKYSVAHNLNALRFIVREIIPLLPEQYELHFTGSKIPDSIKPYMNRRVIHEGFVPDMMDFWRDVDIAVVPSLFGAGMQQKVFEPITFGVPTVTSRRAAAGYPIGEDTVLFAESATEYAQAIVELAENRQLRERLSVNAITTARSLFLQQKIDAVLLANLPV